MWLAFSESLHGFKCKIAIVPFFWSSFWIVKPFSKRNESLNKSKIFFSAISSFLITFLKLSIDIVNPIPFIIFSLGLKYFTNSSYLPPLAMIVFLFSPLHMSWKTIPSYKFKCGWKVGSNCIFTPYLVDNFVNILNKKFISSRIKLLP